MTSASRPRRRPSLLPKIASLTITAIALSLAATAGTAAAPEPLILGVHPYLLPAEIVARFAPLAGYLDKRLGRRGQGRGGRDYRPPTRNHGRPTPPPPGLGAAAF